ncbi:MAG: DUF3144 domain-containing protein [Bacteroidetes bacterium]|nr:DUF3144 domain-containing protein [Bacteroidota bacterium]
MVNDQKKYSRHEMADMFIKIANDLTEDESVERISSAFLYAAARFNAFEAASKSKHLKKDKEDVMQWFVKEYQRMLDVNIDEYVESLGKSNYHPN